MLIIRVLNSKGIQIFSRSCIVIVCNLFNIVGDVKPLTCFNFTIYHTLTYSSQENVTYHECNQERLLSPLINRARLSICFLSRGHTSRIMRRTTFVSLVSSSLSFSLRFHRSQHSNNSPRMACHVFRAVHAYFPASDSVDNAIFPHAAYFPCRIYP